MTQKHGRWLRVTKDSGSPQVINLDNVEGIFKGASGANFMMSSGDVVLTREPFEDICLRVMVVENDPPAYQPIPPISRDQLVLFEEAQTEQRLITEYLHGTGR